MLTIYGNKMSGSSQKVEYVAQLLKLDYVFKGMDFQKDLKTPAYLKIHPAGKIPAIDDDGFILFESGAICKYLCEKYDSSLIPKSLKERALMEQWVDFVNLQVGIALGKVAGARVFAPMLKLPVNEASLNEGLQQLDRFLPIIEHQLAKNSHLAGKEMTLADIALLAALNYAEMANVDLSSYKALTQWRTSLQHQDFYRKVHAK